jgi:hypothetical protein
MPNTYDVKLWQQLKESDYDLFLLMITKLPENIKQIVEV